MAELHKNGQRKLTEDECKNILNMYTNGLSQTEISKKLTVSQGVVSRIICEHRENSRRILGLHPALLFGFPND